MGDLSEWLPWIYSFIALLAGWILRWWYDDGKFAEYNNRLQAKDQDIFHLNEAHNLLLQDKKTKINSNAEELAMKERVIGELTAEIRQLRSTAGTTGATADRSSVAQTASKKKKVAAKKAPSKTVSIVSKIDKKAKKSKHINPIKSSSDVAEDNGKPNDPAGKKATSQKDELKAKLKKSQRKIDSLQAEKKALIKKLSSVSKDSVKEVPVTITKTIKVKERVNRKKLNKLLKKVPFKVTKKESSKVTKGHPVDH